MSRKPTCTRVAQLSGLTQRSSGTRRRLAAAAAEGWTETQGQVGPQSVEVTMTTPPLLS